MTSPSVILDREWRGRRGGGWTVRVEPNPDPGSPLGGTWPEYQNAALYASQLARSRGWQIIRRGEARQAPGA